MPDKSYEDTLEGSQREIVRERRAEQHAQRGDLYRKFQELSQADEQTRVNRHSEGYCYGCARYDRVVSSLWFACESCSARRGREGLMAVVCRKYTEEFCDYCALWKLGVRQLNVSMCHRCMRRVRDAHDKYRAAGGRMGHPFHKKMVKKYGRDYQEILGRGVRWKLA